MVEPTPNPNPNNVITTTGSLAQRPRPVATAPRHNFDVSMALFAEDQMSAIAEALREALDKKPGAAKFLVGLVAPLGLAIKGLFDFFRAITLDPTKHYLIDWTGLMLALAAIAIGSATTAAVAVQLINDRKPSKILELAKRHADSWLHQFTPDEAKRE